MTGSVLIFGSTKKLREEKILEIVNSEANKDFESVSDLSEKPDIKIFELKDDEKTIGIGQTREGIKFLQERPFSYIKKFLLIFDADKLTIQAQNSLLKTLEEPPSYAVILLSVKTRNSLLDTIISRCRLIPVTKDDNEDATSPYSLQDILKKSVGERLDIASELSKEEKETVLEYLEEWISQGRKMLLKKPNSTDLLYDIKRIIKVRLDLENTNVNQKLSLEALVTSFLQP